MRTLLLSLVAILALAPSARADEGLWTYNNFPKAAVKQKYKVDVNEQWLEHVRLSSVRFNNGGSGSFVSPTGLVMTNHHIGADCIHELARSDKDLIKNGFYAKTRDEEIKCPDLELNVLVDIADVTKDVQSVAKPGMDDAAINKAQKEKMSAIEKECADRTHNRCDVVTLYHGGVYNLYTYKKYTDVRLVFAPEFQIAFFGGDPDNFELPRYDLDVAYFRVYDDRSKKAEDKAPWDLPPHWVDAKTKVNGKVPMDFVSTNDIIPGDSGSPTVNARGEVVGLIFDGNIQFLVGDFIYDEAQNRAVSVHSSALIEALRHVYDAGPLADELQVGEKHATTLRTATRRRP